MQQRIIHKTLYFIFFFLCCFLNSFSQQGIIKGLVFDSLNAHPVQYAAIRLYNSSDSALVKGGMTNDKGSFSIDVSPGKYRIDVSLLGYGTVNHGFKTTSEKPDLDMGTIYLYEDALVLGEALVTAKIPDMVVKGDTIEYNAESYIPAENAVLQDLVKNLPGAELDREGNLSVNGKRINKITVDGKEFFNNDIKMALRNLPANMVKKLQLFQEQTEESKVSGIKRGDGDQVLNLEIKEEFKRSVFGDASLGYGNKGRYSGRTMVNAMQNENMLSVLAGINNTNEDIAGFGSQASVFGRGLDEAKEAATNINIEASEKLSVSGDVSYSNNSNLVEDESRMESIDIEHGSSISSDISRTVTDRKGLSFNTNLNWTPDSQTSVYFRLGGGYFEQQNTENSESVSYYTGKESQKTTGVYNRNSDGDGYNFQGTLNVGRKLNSKGRRVSLGFGGAIRSNKSKGFNESLTRYTSGVEAKFQDQRLQVANDNSSFTFSISYVEPVTKNNSLTASYSLNGSEGNYTNDKFRKENPSDSLSNYTVIDTLYVSKTVNKRVMQKLELGFQSLHEKYEYTAHFAVEPFSSENTTTRRLDSAEYLMQKAVNFSSRLRYKYNFNTKEQILATYRGATMQPSAEQLSADTANVSNTSKTYGNPNLKAGFENAINVYYQKSDYEKGDFLYIGVSFGNIFNRVVNYSKRDTLFNSERTYKNVSGDWNAGFSLTYNTPIKKDKLSLSTYSSVTLQRNKEFANGEENISHTTSLSENISLNFRSKLLDSRLNIGYNYNLTKNSLQNQNNIEISRISLSNATILNLPFDFKVENDISYSHNFGYGSGYKNSEIMWNASVSKFFLKKKMGTLKIKFYDILKDRNNTIRYAGNGYISDMRTNMINSYFLVSFSYRFNIAKGGEPNAGFF